jgi:hypothetical protein
MAEFLALSQKWNDLGGRQIGCLNNVGQMGVPRELLINLVDSKTRDAMFVTCSQTIWSFYDYLGRLYPNTRMAIITDDSVDKLHFQLV